MGSPELRSQYLAAMGIEVWQRRTVSIAALGSANASAGSLWFVQYPTCLIALTQGQASRQVGSLVSGLLDDLAVALGGDYRKPMLACKPIVGDCEPAAEAFRLLSELPSAVPPKLLVLGESASGQLWGHYPGPQTALELNGYTALVVPEVDEIIGSAAHKRHLWRFLASYL